MRSPVAKTMSGTEEGAWGRRGLWVLVSLPASTPCCPQGQVAGMGVYVSLEGFSDL